VQSGKTEQKAWDFGFLIWPCISNFNPNRDWVFVTGGMEEKSKKIADVVLEVHLKTKRAFYRPPMPDPRYGHAQVVVKDSLIITGGINDLMHEMGIRSVPFGKNDCFKYNVNQAKWSKLADVPVGRVMGTLVAVENRYVFHVGGFEDYEFVIYCLDTSRETNQWMTL